MATRSKKVSVSKAELQETAVAAAVVAEDKIEEGLTEISAGTQDLVAAKKVRRAGRGCSRIRREQCDARRRSDDRRGQTGYAERCRGVGWRGAMWHKVSRRWPHRRISMSRARSSGC